MDKCPCENDVAVLLDTVEKHEKVLTGNGKEGLIVRFARMEETVNDMDDHLDKLATAYSGLVKARDAEVVIQKEHEKNHKYRSEAIQRVGTIMAIVFGLVGVLYVILDYMNGHVQ